MEKRKLKTLLSSETCDTCIGGNGVDWGLNPAFGVEATLSNIQTLFVNGHGLFSYGRFASMETLGKAALRYSALPYPKCDIEDPYITASHDTTEVGGIPKGAENVSEILQMLDILSARSNKDLIHVYYEKELKIRYSSNKQVSSVVDIIHDNMGSAFALAYSEACSGLLLWHSYYVPLRDGRDYLISLQSNSAMLQSALNTLMKKWNEIS